MSSIVEILNNHVNSRLSHNKEKESYISEAVGSLSWRDLNSNSGGSKGGKRGLLGLGALAAGAYGLHKLTSGDEYEGSLASDIGHSLKYHLRGNLDAKTDAELASANEHQARLQNLANRYQSGLNKIHTILPQANNAPQTSTFTQTNNALPQTSTFTQSQPQFQPNDNPTASAIKNVGLATSQFVQQNPLASGAIGAAGAIGAGIMAKRAMQNNRQ